MGYYMLRQNLPPINRRAQAEEDWKKLRLPRRSCQLCCQRPAPDEGHSAVSDVIESKQVSDSHSNAEMKQQMISEGWCYHQVEHLSKTQGLKAFTYLAPRSTVLRRSANHLHCQRMSGCIAYNTDAANYRIKHVLEECSCSMLRIPYDKLIKIIRKGGIPLVSLSGEDMELRARNFNTVYVAISHVWADGLGNPRENALPTCQISKLRERLSALKELLCGLKVRITTRPRMVLSI